MSIFKKIGEFLKKVTSSDLGQAAEQIYIDKLGNLFQAALQATKDKDPDLAQDIVKTVARWAPYLGEAAKKTNTDIDDKVVAELVEQIQAFDTAGGIE